MAGANGAARWKQSEVLGLQAVTHPSQPAPPALGILGLHCRAPSLTPFPAALPLRFSRLSLL